MAKLLNGGIDKDENQQLDDSEDMQRHEKVIKLQNLFLTFDTDDLNICDLYEALSYEGKITGLIETGNYKDVLNNIQTKSKELCFSKAKFIIVIIIASKNISVFTLNNIMSNIENLKSSQANIKFGISSDESFEDNIISCSIFLTGI